MSSDRNNQVGENILESPDSIQEEPVLLALTAVDSGINLISVEFQPDMKSDELLLSGFLTALRNMSDLMFHVSFDEMRFGDYTLLMRVDPPLLFSYIFRGDTEHAVDRLEEFVGILREGPAIVNSLKETISTGAVDKVTKALVKQLTTKIFTTTGEFL